MTHLMILYLHIHTQSCKHLFSYTEQVKLGIFLSIPQIIKLRFFCIFLDVEKKILGIQKWAKILVFYTCNFCKQYD